MKIFAGQKFLKKDYQIRFIQLWNFILSWAEHEKCFISTGPVGCTSLLKTLWEEEKLLVASNFSFSRSVFYQFEELSAIFIRFKIVVCTLFQFQRVKNLSFGKVLRGHASFLLLLQTDINPFLHIYSFYHIEEKRVRKTFWKKRWNCSKCNFTFFLNVFYAIYILISYNSHISVVVCSFFEFGTVSKWNTCVRERANLLPNKHVFYGLQWNGNIIGKCKMLVTSSRRCR